MRALWLVVCLAAAGCGRTALFDLPGPGPVATGGSAGGSGTGGSGAGGSTGTGGTGGSAGAALCTTWSVSPAPPVPLTDPVGDSSLTSLAPDGNHVFVGTMNNDDPGPDPTWRVRVVSDDLSDLGTSHVAMKHPVNVLWWLSGIGIAIGPGYRGAVTADDPQGCRFVELGADGAPIAAPRTIAEAPCFWPIATPPGFVVFSSPSTQFAPITLLALNKHGKVVQTYPDVITTTSSPNQTVARGLARFDDGTLLVAWSDGNSNVMGQHLDVHGNTLASLTALSPTIGRFALGSMGSSALAVLAVGSSGAGWKIGATPLDEDGNPTSSAVALGMLNDDIGRVAVGRAGSAALVAWSLGQSGNYRTLFVRPVRHDGTPLGPPIEVSTLQFIGGIRVIGTATGALVVFEAENNGPVQVFAVRLVCH